MSFQLYSAFVLACFILAITPGPNMALFIANGTAHGPRAALLTVLGSTLSLSLLVVVATFGMSSIMAVMSEWFDVLRWIGAAYLVWLGYVRLRAAFAADEAELSAAPLRGRYVWHGAAASLSNPKILLFLGAFFPQFIDSSAPLAPQLTLMGVTFIAVAASVDSCVAVAAGAARDLLTARRRKLTDGISGALLVGGGLWLALARRS
jgi:threonine/homoserine/homoserine lactone efflux protein